MDIKLILLVMLILILSNPVFATVEDYYVDTFVSSSGVTAAETNTIDGANDNDYGSYVWDTDPGNYVFDVESSGKTGLIPNINNVMIWISHYGINHDDDDITLSHDLGLSTRTWNGPPYLPASDTEQDLDVTSDRTWTWDNITDLTITVSYSKSAGLDPVTHYIDTIWVRIDYNETDPPVVSLNNPQNKYNSSQSSNTFYFTPYDVSSIDSCTLIINNTLNQSSVSITEGVENTVISALQDGGWNWTINCTDFYGNTGSNSSRRTIVVDTTSPNITNIFPTGHYLNNTNNTIYFFYNISDLTSIINCSLIINNQINQTNWSLSRNEINNFSTYLGDGQYNWSVQCTDTLNNGGDSLVFNLTVDANPPPQITQIYLPSEVNLISASNLTVTCNATIDDTGLDSVSAVLFDNSVSLSDPDNNTNHYTNSSCSLVSSSGSFSNYSCAFSLAYYANAASWNCTITAVDILAESTQLSQNFTVNELYAISVNPLSINYSSLLVGYNHTQDEVVTIVNVGNSEIDLALWGFAGVDGDGLAMGCFNGTIPVEYERYDFTASNDPYYQMVSLSGYLTVLQNFDLAKQTSAVLSEKSVYWKMGLPNYISGNCSGNIVLAAVPSE